MTSRLERARDADANAAVRTDGPASAARPRRVGLKRKAVEHYRRLVGDDAVGELRELAHRLRGARVLQLSSTATGGGVAELLSSEVALLRDLGLDAEWQVIAGDPEFFAVTKRLHNGLQGMDVELSPAERDAYLRHNEENARALEDGWDLIVVHDPQPLPIRSLRADAGGRWLWRCHVDSSEPSAPVWEFLRPFTAPYDASAFTLAEFVPDDVRCPVHLLVPAIDPLTSKNRSLPGHVARETVAELGIDLARPLLLQVSRFDPWKDPLGVVAVWRQVRRTVPELQLALAGAMATDDPEGWRIYGEIARDTHDDPDCFLFTSQMGVNAHEVNALQRVADVAIQKSTREGFGLIVAETMWKGTPMVGGRAGGIPHQIEDGVSGRLADDVDGFAAAVAELIDDPARAREIGLAATRRVRERFLLPRLLRDELRLYRRLLDA